MFARELVAAHDRAMRFLVATLVPLLGGCLLIATIALFACSSPPVATSVGVDAGIDCPLAETGGALQVEVHDGVTDASLCEAGVTAVRAEGGKVVPFFFRVPCSYEGIWEPGDFTLIVTSAGYVSHEEKLPHIDANGCGFTTRLGLRKIGLAPIGDAGADGD